MIARLVDRVITAQQGALPLPAAPATSPDYERVKRQVHSEFVESIDLTNLRARARAELEPQMRASLTARLQARSSVLDANERALLVDEILDEILGLGPLERLIRDTSITDILINGPQTVYVEKEGLLYLTNVHFRDGPHLAHVIDRIVSAVGRRIDESSPMVDARLADGSRFNAVIPPLALDGAVVSIRRFGVIPIDVEELVTRGSMPRPMAELLRACIRSKLNILISGGTGTGKTTLLNVLSSFIPGGERIITVEDAAELRLQQPHVIRLETRPPNLEGQGEVACRDLVRNALRMRPDRIIVGEIRGAEAIDMLQAMNTGHEGSLSTIHANSPRHALRRLETLVGLGLGNIPGASIREMVGGALDVIIQVSRLADGVRRLVSITEVVGMEQGVITTQEVFQFEQRSIAPDGRVRGTFRATGVRPVFAERLAAHGAPLAPELLAFHEEV
ncbi:secretion system protein TadA [Deltaproteobacteria bacterium]|nr:secretion system protein TadA [Deltaproteobacteria bacterium]